MSRPLASLLLMLALSVPALVNAEAETLREFDSAEERQRYEELLEELRCLVCQNESLASSKAELAQDLRNEVYRLVVVENRTSEAATEFLTSRYGDFVLYRPPMRPYTMLLWFGPLLMLIVGGGVLALVVRGHRRSAESPLSDPERERAKQLLQGEDDPP